jgi:hypothetical protein
MYSALRRAIECCALREGRVREVELAKSLVDHRSAVRPALRRLQSDAVIERCPDGEKNVSLAKLAEVWDAQVVQEALECASVSWRPAGRATTTWSGCAVILRSTSDRANQNLGGSKGLERGMPITRRAVGSGYRRQP